MNHAKFTIDRDRTDTSFLTIRDEGPWDKHPTITNDAAWVVSQLLDRLHGRRLRYIDSESILDELVVQNGKFAGFLPWRMKGGR